MMGRVGQVEKDKRSYVEMEDMMNGTITENSTLL